jgi:hypothetical protein
VEHVKKRRLLLAAVGALLLAAYILAPCAMGARATMSVVRPWWYVLPLWRDLYVVGWEGAGHEGKPRYPFPAQRKHGQAAPHE